MSTKKRSTNNNERSKQIIEAQKVANQFQEFDKQFQEAIERGDMLQEQLIRFINDIKNDINNEYNGGVEYSEKYLRSIVGYLNSEISKINKLSEKTTISTDDLLNIIKLCKNLTESPTNHIFDVLNKQISHIERQIEKH